MHTVPAGHSGLEVGPQSSQLAQGVIEVVGIGKEANEQTNGEIARRNKVDAVNQNNHLPKVRSKTVHRSKRVVGNACAYGSGIVLVIYFLEALLKVIPAVKGNNDFEVIQAFLYLGAHPAE